MSSVMASSAGGVDSGLIRELQWAHMRSREVEGKVTLRSELPAATALSPGPDP